MLKKVFYNIPSLKILSKASNSFFALFASNNVPVGFLISEMPVSSGRWSNKESFTLISTGVLCSLSKAN